MDVKNLFTIAEELFHSDNQARRDAAFTFFRDVWQLNRIWRAFHDPRNPKKEARVVAELLELHRNTLSNKLDQLELRVSDLKAARNVPELIRRSPSLRRAEAKLRSMQIAEHRELKKLQKVR